jgi:hypothetical protein
MLRARWEADIERVIVERVDGSGRVLGYDRMTREQFDVFVEAAALVRDESYGLPTADPWDGLEHVNEPWPDERVDLGPCAVVDDPEADIPAVVRMDDGASRVELDFREANIDRRLRELGRE